MLHLCTSILMTVSVRGSASGSDDTERDEDCTVFYTGPLGGPVDIVDIRRDPCCTAQGADRGCPCGGGRSVLDLVSDAERARIARAIQDGEAEEQRERAERVTDWRAERGMVDLVDDVESADRAADARMWRPE